ncbi:hypothetical protein Y032_0008g55 [Ancylostoma ceylanicum]|nr:hypothetical protein Y032_0008g55 [Ancylostoma ceylanicum]
MERRLRPIYDAIDAGNAKKAVQEADKVLKKHPVTVCAKVGKLFLTVLLDEMKSSVRSFKNQQLVAMRLFKEFNNSPYFFWGVMSIVMQARENPEMGAKMFYPLAARMVENHVTKYGYKAGAEIELHAMVLEGMNKFAEAEELLGAEESRSLLSTPPSFLMARRIALLLSAGKHETVIDRTVEGLKIE